MSLALAREALPRHAADGRIGDESEIAQILAATQNMAMILRARRLCVRITVGKNSVKIGDHAVHDRDTAEFVFLSDQVFRKIFKRMRLFEFAMAYIEGNLNINGSILKAVDVLDAMNIVTDQRQTTREYLSVVLFRLLKASFPWVATRFESLGHYAQSARAYEMFLDEYMQYTCGRFTNGKEDINEAQVAKFHLIEQEASKYLGSLMGKNHLDVGCGWGGMAGYFMRYFGTKSVGITNCREQRDYARKRYGCEVIYGDFSLLQGDKECFDLVSIVGMIEHLTPRRRSQLLRTVHRLLAPNGVLYLQCIVKPQIWIGGDAYRVAQREIFPGHYLESREQTENRLAKSGFNVVDSFDHSLDYGLTTLRWVRNIEERQEELVELIGSRQYRLYLGYLAFASKLFSTGRGNLMRYVLKKT